MTSVAHELMILDSIETAAFCTECLQDYLSCALTQIGSSRHYLCFACYEQARQHAAAARSKSLTKGSSSPR
jgi:hypothetical protein